jgi:hypothetical protein
MASIFNNLWVDNDFYGVTTTKGDLIVNDGIKNASLGIGADNYVLTADSTQPLGVKWAAVTGGGGILRIEEIDDKITSLEKKNKLLEDQIKKQQMQIEFLLDQNLLF